MANKATWSSEVSFQKSVKQRPVRSEGQEVRAINFYYLMSSQNVLSSIWSMAVIRMEKCNQDGELNQAETC